MKRCHCIKGDLWIQTEVEEGKQQVVEDSFEKWRWARKFIRTPWDLRVIKVESPDHDNNIMVPFVSTAGALVVVVV